MVINMKNDYQYGNQFYNYYNDLGIKSIEYQIMAPEQSQKEKKPEEAQKEGDVSKESDETKQQVEEMQNLVSDLKYDYEEQHHEYRSFQSRDESLNICILEYPLRDKFSVHIADQSDCYCEYGQGCYRYRLESFGEEAESVPAVTDSICCKSRQGKSK